jgi:hypothetical protein
LALISIERFRSDVMRVIFVIGLLVAAVFITVLFLVDLAQELSRQPYQIAPDLGDTDDWNAVADEAAGAAPSAGNHRYGPASPNALDDLRSAL